MTEASQKFYDQLSNGTKTIDSFDPEKAAHRTAVLKYLQSKPSKIKELRTVTENAFLKYCLEKDYKLFIYLSPAQRTEEFAKEFLEKKILSEEKREPGFFKKSFDESFVLNVGYQTCDGEQIFYYDEELQLSTFLVAKLNVAFKVESVLEFFKKLDVSVCMVGYNGIYQELQTWVKNAYRKAINDFIFAKQISVYKTNSIYDEIEESIAEILGESLEGSGISVHKVNVAKISVTDTMQKILENQSLELMKDQRKRDAEIAYEKKALENYAQKAEIHAKNPEFALTLTEAEKDFALSRYITKHDVDLNRYKKEVEQNETLVERKEAAADEAISKTMDKPMLAKKSYRSLLLLIPALILIVVGIAVAEEVGGFIIPLFIGLAMIVMGFAFASLVQNRVNIKKSTDGLDKEEYEARLEEYNNSKRGAK